MAEYYRIKGETLTSIADAIRSKKESTAFFSPEQMATEIDGIVIGDNLAIAEEALFGTPSSDGEPGFTTAVAFSSDGESGINNIRMSGYRFTVNAPIALLGFRQCNGTRGSAETTFTLWDDATKTEVAVLKETTKSSLEWKEYRLPAPINLEVGKTYIISQYGLYRSYNWLSKLTDIKYNPKIGNVTFWRNSSFGYKYPVVSSDSFAWGLDILIGAPITESVVTEYKIQHDTMNDIADEVRRITGNSGTMSTAEILTALQGIEAVTTE